MNFFWAILASVLVSLISLVGIVSFLLKEDFLEKVLFLLVGFGAGGLIGGAFLHLLPESLELTGNNLNIFVATIAGFVLFFVLEHYLYWRHCHKGKCDVHLFTYLNLFGDGIHNFIDGLIIGASFFVGPRIGVVTALIIILHEIPQELGDFGVLVYGGFTRWRALFYNLLSAVTAIAGTVVGYLFSGYVGMFSRFLLPIAAGGFIYIAACDLIPQLYKESSSRRASASLIVFLSGIVLMYFFKIYFH